MSPSLYISKFNDCHPVEYSLLINQVAFFLTSVDSENLHG